MVSDRDQAGAAVVGATARLSSAGYFGPVELRFGPDLLTVDGRKVEPSLVRARLAVTLGAALTTVVALSFGSVILAGLFAAITLLGGFGGYLLFRAVATPVQTPVGLSSIDGVRTGRVWELSDVLWLFADLWLFRDDGNTVSFYSGPTRYVVRLTSPAEHERLLEMLAHSAADTPDGEPEQPWDPFA